MVLPTARAAAMLAVASLAVLAAPGRPGAVLLVVDGALVALTVLDGAVAVRPRTIRLQRRLPPVLTSGRSGALTWSVANDRRRGTVRVALADELPPSWRCRDRRARLVVPPGRQVSVTRTIRPARRGRFRLSEVVVRSEGPLRLGARQGRLAVVGQLRVRPAFPSRAATEVRVDRARAAEIGARTSTGRGGGTEFDQLREYQVDDDIRRLDWAATARSGKAVVRTYRAERNQNLTVVLDTGRPMAATVEGIPRLEHALDAVQALSAAAARLGDRFALLAHDDTTRISLPPRLGVRTAAVADALCEVQPRFVETDFRAAFAHADRLTRRRSLVVVLTDLAEEATVDALDEALALLHRRHLVVVGAVADPELSRWILDPPDGDEVAGAFRAAAAARALEGRRRAAARLSAAGAVCLDDAPRRLTLRLVETYLDLKAGGRL